MKKKIISFGILCGAIVFSAALVSADWQDPDPECAPPDCNAAAPIHVGDEEQTKTGAFNVEGGFTTQGIRSFLSAIFDTTVTVGEEADKKGFLQVYGDADITGTLTAGNFAIGTGASEGKVLTSDAEGNATWETPAPSGTTLTKSQFYTNSVYRKKSGAGNYGLRVACDAGDIAMSGAFSVPTNNYVNHDIYMAVGCNGDNNSCTFGTSPTSMQSLRGPAADGVICSYPGSNDAICVVTCLNLP